MPRPKPPTFDKRKVVAENRRARFDYAIEDDLECGIVLSGSEVKSLRETSANIAESYAAVEDGELWLVNSYIAPYDRAMFPHEERRRRKLVRRSHFLTIAAAWLVTVPAAAGLSALCYLALSFFPA